MERKSDKVRRLVADGDFKGALRIAKDFRLGMADLIIQYALFGEVVYG